MKVFLCVDKASGLFVYQLKQSVHFLPSEPNVIGHFKGLITLSVSDMIRTGMTLFHSHEGIFLAFKV